MSQYSQAKSQSKDKDEEMRQEAVQPYTFYSFPPFRCERDKPCNEFGQTHRLEREQSLQGVCTSGGSRRVEEFSQARADV